MEEILRLFPQLSTQQQAALAQLPALYAHWNEKINVVSRKDIDQLLLHHVLHSLAIGLVCPLKDGAQVMDLGTGGGFPGIPLAIVYPQAQLVLVDSIGKKTTVAQAVALELGLANVQVLNTRAEKVDEQFDFVVTRAVAPLNQLVEWTRGKFFKSWYHPLKNGLLALKGGDLSQELAECPRKVRVFPLASYLPQPYFETKALVHVPMP